MVAELRRIGDANGDRTPSQVALNWLIAKGAVPIPGAKNRPAGRGERRRAGLVARPPTSWPRSTPVALEGTRSLGNRFWQHG